jgi:hypothetical protein
LRISNAKDAQINTTDAYAKAMDGTPRNSGGRLVYRSLRCHSADRANSTRDL